MKYILNKKGKLLFLILCVIIIGMLMKHSYTLNNAISVSKINNKAYVAIIIDDFGYNGDGTEEMLSLDIPFTAAVMPFLNNTTDNAKRAYDAGKDVIVHMPMESYTGKKSWLGPKSIMKDMTNEDVNNIINEALEQIEWAVGINNHMGSKITEDDRIMKDILNITKENNLIFIDSMTTPMSVTHKISNELGTYVLYRNIFLDSTQDQDIVEKNIKELGRLALDNGYAIGIGHVGPEGGKVTAAALKKIAPELEKQGIVFVTVTELKALLYN